MSSSPTSTIAFGLATCFLVIIISKVSSAQNQLAGTRTVDSLKQVLQKPQSDSVRLKALNAFAWETFCLARKTGKDEDSIVRTSANAALELSKRLKNKYQHGLAMYTLASLDRRDGKFPQALKKYYDILTLSQDIGDKLCEANQYSNIGDMYSIQGNVDEAIDNHRKAIKIFEESGDRHWCIYAYNRIANVYEGAALHDEALKYYQLAVSVSKQINSKEEEAKCYVSLGNFYKNKGEFPEARNYFNLATDFFKNHETDFPDECCNIYTGMGWINCAEGYLKKSANPKESYLEALRNFQKALQFAKLTRSRWYLNEAYMGLSKTYRQLEDIENALEYTVLQYQVRDSFMNKDAMDSMRKLKGQYEADKRQIEEKAKQQVFLAELNSMKSRINEEKLKEEIALSQERGLRERQLSEQKIAEARKMADAKGKYDKSIALEQSRQRQLKEQQERNNFLILMVVGTLLLLTTFSILFLRQRNQKIRAIEKAEAVHRVAALELQSLRSQLNPHFMFNSLNAIQELILLEENDKSHVYLSRFSRLLRMLLDNADQPFVSLQQEIEFLRLYLDLESLRVADLKYSIFTSPLIDKENTLLPNMILQPYIENAIWHGLSYKEKDKEVKIRIYPDDGMINCEIEDNGVGRQKAEEFKSLFKRKHNSKGMELLNKRFKLLNEEYSSRITTVVTDVVKGNRVEGTLVTIKIPLTISEQLLETV